ncbi:hypothetical protein KEJ29_02425 [Candidatus Bathyarchaeota archaeon]|nr:hypothetical protein [Candidatus Bathyarchaeota archaeon]
MIGKKLLLILSLVIVLAAGAWFFYFVPNASPKLSSPPIDISLNVYVNQTAIYAYESPVESMFGSSLKVSIDYFPEEIMLTTVNYEVIPRVFPYILEVNLEKGKNFSFSLYVTAFRPGSYIVNLRFLLSYWIFSQEYRQKIIVNASLPKPPAQVKPISILLDKTSYTQGEPILITIINNLNESIMFANAACELRFEIFNGTSWVYVRNVSGDPTPVSLEPGGRITVRDMLYLSSGVPFQPGRYRVGTRDVYVEFNVVRPMT